MAGIGRLALTVLATGLILSTDNGDTCPVGQGAKFWYQPIVLSQNKTLAYQCTPGTARLYRLTVGDDEGQFGTAV